LIFKVISIILMFILVHQKSDYIVYGAITVLAAGGSNVLNFINLRKFIDFRPVGHYNFRRHLKPIFIFFATTAAISIYTNLDTVMLGFMTTDTQVGLFNASIKVKSILLSAVTSLGAVLLPRLSYYLHNHMKQKFNDMIRKAFNFILVFAVPLSVYFFIFARPSILLLSGNAFLGAVLPMQILMPTIVFIGFSNITGMQILVPYGKESCLLVSVIAGAVLDFSLNLVLIPRWGATGTAVSTLSAELLVLAIQLYILRFKLKGIWKKLSIRQMLIGMIFAVGASLWIRHVASLRPIFILMVSACVFFGIYYICLLIQKEPFMMDMVNPVLQKVWNRKKMER
jgi:O-antigen/teichoic acid export membrane protein